MSEPKDGGRAFPVVKGSVFQPGMSMRDYFAAKAMVVGLSEPMDYPDENWRYGIALDAYKMADAMLAARGGQP